MMDICFSCFFDQKQVTLHKGQIHYAALQTDAGIASCKPACNQAFLANNGQL
jgi:hypothetical protein